MRFEWDEQKNEVNRRKHGIAFETAKLVFDDPNCLLFVERIEDAEERWHAIGIILQTAVILTVVHSHRTEGSDEIVRIISARHATEQEQTRYAQFL